MRRLLFLSNLQNLEKLAERPRFILHMPLKQYIKLNRLKKKHQPDPSSAMQISQFDYPCLVTSAKFSRTRRSSTKSMQIIRTHRSSPHNKWLIRNTETSCRFRSFTSILHTFNLILFPQLPPSVHDQYNTKLHTFKFIVFTIDIIIYVTVERWL